MPFETQLALALAAERSADLLAVAVHEGAAVLAKEGDGPATLENALLAQLDSATPPLVVDLRHELDLEANPTSLPGAVVVGMNELLAWAEGVPREREIILTCD